MLSELVPCSKHGWRPGKSLLFNNFVNSIVIFLCVTIHSVLPFPLNKLFEQLFQNTFPNNEIDIFIDK